MRLLALVLALITTDAAAVESALPGNPCHIDTPCAVGERSYHVREPDGWDGVSPLPVMLHFHGWARTGKLPVKHQRISGHTRRRGVLLVAPNGLHKTWRFRGGREDVDFAEAVLEDVMRRYPVDRETLFVSGYSFGSAMAWRFVCESGNDIRALFAVAGTLRQSETCVEAPAVVRHVHGTSDRVMDFPFGPDGDRLHPVRLWRDRLGCGAATDEGRYQIVEWLSFNRHRWDCAEGDVILDVHNGGHFIPHGWLGRQLDEMLGLDPAYP
jgi:polyhydroxybutyrate depolymerase